MPSQRAVKLYTPLGKSIVRFTLPLLTLKLSTSIIFTKTSPSNEVLFTPVNFVVIVITLSPYLTSLIVTSNLESALDTLKLPDVVFPV